MKCFDSRFVSQQVNPSVIIVLLARFGLAVSGWVCAPVKLYAGIYWRTRSWDPRTFHFASKGGGSDPGLAAWGRLLAGVAVPLSEDGGSSTRRAWTLGTSRAP